MAGKENLDSLPTPYARVSLLPSGFLSLPEHFFCADQHDVTVKNLVPIVFDLGIRRNLDEYPADIQPHLQTRQPIHTVPDASESLRNGGLEPSDVDIVVLSHVHYDHVGDPREFTSAQFMVGYGTRHLLQHGMKYHSAAKFEKDLLPPDRTIELPEPEQKRSHAKPIENSCLPTHGLDTLIRGIQHRWKAFGPFPNAMDLFGDGSIYIVDSPGHLPGHLNLLARIGDASWVYLAGDACHHPRILHGETGMATWMENDMHVCIHSDKSLAEDTVQRIAKLMREGIRGGDQVRVALAHDGDFLGVTRRQYGRENSNLQRLEITWSAEKKRRYGRAPDSNIVGGSNTPAHVYPKTLANDTVSGLDRSDTSRPAFAQPSGFHTILAAINKP
ncbi:unnamed protein product [Parascedosporium putredinis]|uniref:Metallo-beta-lactamase domain-containing protein n=1 Tax=Parascedosporium putredinis TaxID=1442378 RepID=A0A9P1MCN6_9PEZI|nr:unnamed protein product [Parascedosporium putredinis]CAI7996932.1 unnamed protein product [Parascedosporium putredinis]